MSTSIQNDNQNNKNIENLIRHTSLVIRGIKKIHDHVKRSFYNAPIQIKVLTIILIALD